jgi:hypothetical protein
LLVYKTFSLFRSDEEFSFINDANKKIANNKKMFMPIFLIIVQVCLVCVAVLVVLRIIKS